MFAFVYLICFFFCATYFVKKWSDGGNKTKSVLGIIWSFLPVLNILLTIVVAVTLWNKHRDAITAWWRSV